MHKIESPKRDGAKSRITDIPNVLKYPRIWTE